MLSLALIVKNEEKNLSRCLDSVQGLWDELVIVDTGSTDNTVEIAKRYTPNVYYFEWVDHFAKARNYAFSKCTQPWIMWLDADDALKPEDVAKIKEEFPKLAIQPHIRYILMNYHYSVIPPNLENGKPAYTQVRERIIRKEFAHWENRCHEIITVNYSHTANIEANVWHLRDLEDMTIDRDRNIRLMKLTAEENPTSRNFFYLGDEYYSHGMHKEAIESYTKTYDIADHLGLTYQASYKLGLVHKDIKEKNKAIKWFKESLHHSVKYREPLIELAQIYMERHNFNKVLFWAKASLEIEKPSSPEMAIKESFYTFIPYHYITESLYHLKRYSECEEYLEKYYEITNDANILVKIQQCKSDKRKQYKRPEGIIKLNLGSGNKRLDDPNYVDPIWGKNLLTGFINCDYYPGPEVDETFSFLDVPYADRSVDEIYSEHALEHVPRIEGEKALTEWARVLKRGGKLYLRVPDLMECCKQFIQNPEIPNLHDSWYLHTLYGVQDFRGDSTASIKDKVNYGQIHYTGFTKRRLQDLLEKNGFQITRLENYDGWSTPSIHCEAIIPDIPDSERKNIAFINNTLIPRYLSYGDYWEDAFHASGHELTTYKYEEVSRLPSDKDIYFFIERRYDPSLISSNARPRVLYTKEDQSPETLNHFDYILTPDTARAELWQQQGYNVTVIPNDNHLKQIDNIVELAKPVIKEHIENIEASQTDFFDYVDPRLEQVQVFKPANKTKSKAIWELPIEDEDVVKISTKTESIPNGKIVQKVSVSTVDPTPKIDFPAQFTVLQSPVTPPRELKKTDIIIPSYKNKAYIEKTINSVRRNTQDYNLIVVNSGSDLEVRNYLSSLEDIIFIDSTDRLTFSQAINLGLKYSLDNTSNDVVLLNNDVLVGKDWLEPLKNSPFDITNPFSNCDKGWIHNVDYIINNVSLVPNMFIGEGPNQISLQTEEAILNSRSPYADVIKRPWVAFYATYIKRQVIEKTGLLDDTFKNGGEDCDYCNRATKLGFTCGHSFSSFVFHYGGKTRKVSEEDNYVQHHEEDRFNTHFLQEKQKKTVCIYTGPAFERWTVNNINEKGIGGSETCAALLAEALAKKGYRSIIIGDCKGLEGKYNGVEYIDHSEFTNFINQNYIDYFISSRTTSPFAHNIKSNKNFVWVHDIWLCGLEKYAPIPFNEKINNFVCLSPWHVNFFSDHHSLSKDKIKIIGNGLDLSRYQNYTNIVKEPNRLFYSSSPDRGLFELLQMFRGWKNEFPDLTLHVYYGFFNWEQAIRQRNNPNELQYLNNIKTLMEQPGVVNHGRIPQNKLAIEQMKSSLWVYPTSFHETYCITGVEAMIAGAIPVTTDRAALATTIPNNCGIKVNERNPWLCSDKALELLRNPQLQEHYRTVGREYVMNNCGWDQIVEKWIQLFELS